MDKARFLAWLLCLWKTTYTITIYPKYPLGGRTKNLSSCKKALVAISKLRYVEKGQTIPREKVPLFLDINFLLHKIAELPSNLSQRELCPLSIEWLQGYWVFLDKLLTLRALPISRPFRVLCSVKELIRLSKSLLRTSFNIHELHITLCEI